MKKKIIEKIKEKISIIEKKEDSETKNKKYFKIDMS